MLRAASEKHVDLRNVHETTVLVLFSGFLAEKLDFGNHFGRLVDSEGGPKIAFLVIMLEKNKKKEVQERLRKKHEIYMKLKLQGVCFISKYNVCKNKSSTTNQSEKKTMNNMSLSL